ncbi:VOC family protein [Streptomyces sp. 8L]|uniref:VOC family protein n=1 Tax=Streptomyces sp. 8L TaxID=2877242 RepID=UPI001CD697B0|nr:VOC family protein [Streptomyces sp. 8L]MCA1221626.1 VOC family protein [Streptomyces sp. 8L]
MEMDQDKKAPSDTVAGAPCWVTLISSDLAAAQRFYSDVLGWTYRDTSLGEGFCVALTNGSPVAGIGGLTASLPVSAAWTPYFAVAGVDTAAARIRERGATVAVGPLAFHTGRAALATDPDGAAFGIWEGAVRSDWTVGQGSAPAWLELRTRDASDATRFYGQVLGWSDDEGSALSPVYEDGDAVLRQGGRVVARIGGGASPSSADPGARPRWRVYFRVPDVARSVAAAVALGGALVQAAADGAQERDATLRDPDGALFTVTPA